MFETLFKADSQTALMIMVACVAALVLVFLAVIFYYVGFWKTLQKMGRHDFASLVPLYGPWELARGAGFGPGLATVMVLLLAGSAVCVGYAVASLDFEALRLKVMALLITPTGQFSVVAQAFASELAQSFWQQFAPLIVAGGVMALMTAILGMVMCYGISRSFGHGIGIMLGLIILPFLFLLILGCSEAQIYEGPYLSHSQRLQARTPWETLVAARKSTFGSNAPLAFAILGLMMGTVLLTIPGIVLCIVALVRNSAEKGKPLASTKCTMTTVVAVLGILVSIAMLVVFLLLGLAANTLYTYN